MARWLTMMLAGIASVALAEDEAQRRAREELEKQLSQMVGSAPSRVRVEFQSVDDPNFKVEEFEISVDGKPLKVPTTAAIANWVQDGPMPIGSTDVTPGQHKVTAKVTLHNTASALATDEGDHRWKLAGDVSFQVSAGLEVKVVVTTSRDPKQADIGKRLRISFPSQPVMIAKLEDGTMPEPVKPNLAPPAVDAGTLVAAVDPAQKPVTGVDEKKRRAEEALAAKQAAAEEKKRKAEEALAAKRAAAEEKKRKAEEAIAAKKAAADEKKRTAEEAIAAKKAAAEEKKRQAEEAVAAKAAAAAEEARRKADAVIAKQEDSQAHPGEPLGVFDAGATVVAVAEPVDAGAVVAEAPVDAGTTAVAERPQAPESPDEGIPWLPIGGGVALLAVLIGVLVKRVGRVPEIKD